MAMWELIAHLLNSFLEISQTGKSFAERRAFDESNWKQFYSLVIPAHGGYNGFYGAAARIVTKEENISLRIFARNEAGDYFFVYLWPQRTLHKTSFSPDGKNRFAKQIRRIRLWFVPTSALGPKLALSLTRLACLSVDNSQIMAAIGHEQSVVFTLYVRVKPAPTV